MNEGPVGPIPEGPPSTPPDTSAERRSLGKLLLSVVAVGALTGVVGAVFRIALRETQRRGAALLAWSHGFPAWGYFVPVAAAAAAAALARWLVRRFAPEAAGSGIPRVEAIVRQGVELDSWTILPVKFVGGLAALGAGLALGREGPTVQMGATIGGQIATRLRMSTGDGRVLVVGGAAAGLATAFGAPIGGAVFILEEVLQRFEGRSTIAVLGATGAAMAVTQLLLGTSPLFMVRPIDAPPWLGLVPCLGFGLLLGLLGAAYNRLVVLGLDLADRPSGVPSEVRAAAIGAIFGLLAWFAPEFSGGGEAQMQQLLAGGGPAFLGLLTLAGFRFVLGPVAYAAGTPGGLFAPILLVGGAMGGLAGLVLHEVAPLLAPDPIVFILAGSVGFFTATVRAPLTGIALLVEMTAVTSLSVQMLAAACGAFASASLLGSPPVYDSLRERRAHAAGVP